MYFLASNLKFALYNYIFIIAIYIQIKFSPKGTKGYQSYQNISKVEKRQLFGYQAKEKCASFLPQIVEDRVIMVTHSSALAGWGFLRISFRFTISPALVAEINRALRFLTIVFHLLPFVI